MKYEVKKDIENDHGINIIPYVRHMKKRFEENTRHILQTIGIDRDEYKSILFEYGMRFLETYYNAYDLVQNEWIEKFSKDKKYGYWEWWEGEWKIAEHRFLLHHEKFDMNKWLDFIYKHTMSDRLQRSFYDYLKYMKYKL